MKRLPLSASIMTTLIPAVRPVKEVKRRIGSVRIMHSYHDHALEVV
jgi:hypothetical protein